MSETKALTVAEKTSKLSELLESRQDQIARALPEHLTPERMTRVALTAYQRTPALQECSLGSIVGCVIEASQLGLETDGVLGQGYLVPFKNKNTNQKEAQFIIGYRGMITLARRSGEIQSISAEVVHEKDEFKVTKGLHPDIQHEPCWNDDPGQMVCVYAVAQLKDGGVQFAVMSLEEVDKVRRKSAGSNSPAWKDHYEEMAKKTVIRRLFKYLPVSVEDVQRAINQDEYREMGVMTGDAFVRAPKDVTGTAMPQTEEESLAETWAEIDALKEHCGDEVYEDVLAFVAHGAKEPRDLSNEQAHTLLITLRARAEKADGTLV